MNLLYFFASTGYGSTTIHVRARGLLPPLKYGVEGVLAVQTPPGGHSHTYPGYPQRKDWHIGIFFNSQKIVVRPPLSYDLFAIIFARQRYITVLLFVTQLTISSFEMNIFPHTEHPMNIFLLMFTSSPQKSVQIAVPFRIKCS